MSGNAAERSGIEAGDRRQENRDFKTVRSGKSSMRGGRIDLRREPEEFI
jgi:hypothetical protein